MTAPIRIRPRVTVDWVDPLMEEAMAWAGDNEDRWQTDVLAAFVAMVRAIDEYHRRGEAEP